MSIALVGLFLAVAKQECPVVSPGLPTGVSIVSIASGGEARVNGAKVTSVPYSLKRGDKVTTSGIATLGVKTSDYGSKVLMKDASVTLVGETESVDKLTTWDLCPEKGSYFVDEGKAQVELQRRLRFSGGFTRPKNLFLPLPVAFRRGRVRLYSVGTQYFLDVENAPNETRWNVNLTDGSVAFERDGYEVYRQTAKIKFSAVVSDVAVRLKGRKWITPQQAERKACSFSASAVAALRLAGPDPTVTDETGLYIDGNPATKGQVLKVGQTVKSSKAGGVIQFGGTECVTFSPNFEAKFTGTNGGTEFDMEVQDCNGSVKVVSCGNPWRAPLILPVVFVRRKVRLYSPGTDYQLAVSSNGDTWALNVNSQKVIVFVDLAMSVYLGPLTATIRIPPI